MSDIGALTHLMCQFCKSIKYNKYYLIELTTRLEFIRLLALSVRCKCDVLGRCNEILVVVE